MKVALISCGKQKRTGTHVVKDLYTSPRFRFAFAYAKKKKCFDRVYILSAYYGLLEPTTRVPSYNTTLTNAPINERRRWSIRVKLQIARQIPRGSHLVFLCPQTYTEPLASRLELDGYTCARPLKGLRQGEQLRWLKCKAG